MAKRKRKKSWSVGPIKLITEPKMSALRSHLEGRRGTATGERQRLNASRPGRSVESASFGRWYLLVKERATGSLNRREPQGE